MKELILFLLLMLVAACALRQKHTDRKRRRHAAKLATCLFLAALLLEPTAAGLPARQQMLMLTGLYGAWQLLCLACKQKTAPTSYDKTS